MPLKINFKGFTIIYPGVYTNIDVSRLENIISGVSGILALIGSARDGISKEPVIFTDIFEAINHYGSGDLVDALYIASNSFANPPTPPPQVIICYRTNPVQRASFTIQSIKGINILKIYSRYWNLKGNQDWFNLSKDTNTNTFTLNAKGKEGLITKTFGNWFLKITNITSDKIIHIKIEKRTTGKYFVVEIIDQNTNNIEQTFEFEIFEGYLIQNLINDLGVISAIQVEPNLSELGFETINLDLVDININPNERYIFSAYGYELKEALENVFDVEVLSDFEEPQEYQTTFLQGAVENFPSTQDIIDGINAIKNLPATQIAICDSNKTSFQGWVSVLLSQLNENNSAKGRNERQAYLGVDVETKEEAIQISSSLQSPYIVLFIQKGIWNIAGRNKKLPPWAFGVACASMKASAPLGKPLTFKYPRVVSIDDKLFGKPINENIDLITKGICLVDKVEKGIRIIRGNTTYFLTQNDALISEEVVQIFLAIKKSIRENLEDRFIGEIFTNPIDLITNAIQSILDSFVGIGVLVPTTDEQGNPLPPYRNLQVKREGDTILWSVEATTNMGINFIVGDVILTKLKFI